MADEALVVTPQQFGAVGDGRHRDAPAFRDALAYLSGKGGGMLYVPRGRYNLTDDFVTSGGQNAILPLPAIPQGHPNIALRIVGEANIPAFGPPVPQGGVVLFSDSPGRAAHGVRPSVIGYSARSVDAIAWSAMTFEMRNLTLRVRHDSGVTPIDLYAVANAVLENVTVSTDLPPGSLRAPTDRGSRGLVLPATGNFGWVKAHKIYAIGFYFGIQHSEHADIEGLIQSCVSALYIPDSYSHLAKYRITTQGCSYSIYSEAMSSPTFGFCNSIVGELDIERDPELPFAADIFAAKGTILNGILNYNVAADPNSGVSVTGGGSVHLILNNAAKPQTAQAITGFAPTASATVEPLAMRTIVIPSEDLAADITISVAPGSQVGQSVRVYGHARRSVTVKSTTAGTRPGPTPHLAPEVRASPYTLPPRFGAAHYVDMVWSGRDWRVEARGALG